MSGFHESRPKVTIPHSVYPHCKGNPLNIPGITIQPPKKSAVLPRREFLMFGLTFLGGCTQSPILANAAKAIKYLAVGLPGADISRDLVSKIPYASMSAKIGKGPRSLLILSRYTKSDRHWISADNAILVTRHGRVIKTVGFPENLLSTSTSLSDPVNRRLHKLKSPVRYHRTVDIDLDNMFGVPIFSVFEPMGPRKITIADFEIKTFLVREESRALNLNWSFTNYYWVDAFDGFVWKSRQHIARSFEPIDIEILKPAA